MSTTLIIFRKDHKEFDENEFVALIRDIPGIQKVCTENLVNSLIEADFIDDVSFTTISLSKNKIYIYISGIDDTSIKLVVELQMRYPFPLHMVDTNYCFSINLQGVNSIDEINKKIMSSVFEDVEGL